MSFRALALVSLAPLRSNPPPRLADAAERMLAAGTARGRRCGPAANCFDDHPPTLDLFDLRLVSNSLIATACQVLPDNPRSVVPLASGPGNGPGGPAGPWTPCWPWRPAVRPAAPASTRRKSLRSSEPGFSFGDLTAFGFRCFAHGSRAQLQRGVGAPSERDGQREHCDEHGW